LDRDAFQGHALYELFAPGVFHLYEEGGQFYVLLVEVSPQGETNVRFAAAVI
jgi:hypothetical protein